MKGFATCLWFDNQAGAAARFYTSVFRNGRMGGTMTVTTATLEEDRKRVKRSMEGRSR